MFILDNCRWKFTDIKSYWAPKLFLIICFQLIILSKWYKCSLIYLKKHVSDIAWDYWAFGHDRPVYQYTYPCWNIVVFECLCWITLPILSWMIISVRDSQNLSFCSVSPCENVLFNICESPIYLSFNFSLFIPIIGYTRVVSNLNFHSRYQNPVAEYLTLSILYNLDIDTS